MIEELKNDALKCGMDLGRDEVVAPDGVLKIAEVSKASLADKLEIVTKELYREGGKQDGVLARGQEKAWRLSESFDFCHSLNIVCLLRNEGFPSFSLCRLVLCVL